MHNYPEDREICDVSVIMPAYQAALTIGRALESIANQTRKPREVVIVDDGSTDQTCDIVAAFNNKINGVDLRFYQQSNAGAGRARNKAMAEARGKYLAFLDADDEWLPQKLEISLTKLQDNNCDLASHNYYYCDSGRPMPIDCEIIYAASKEPFVTLYRKGYIATSTVVARRKTVLAAGGFDESLPNAQDFDFWLEILKARNVKFMVFKELLTNYHVTPNSIMSRTSSRLRCSLIIACRHAHSLKYLRQPVLPNLWYRIIAVHYETFCSYRNHSRFFSMALTAIKLPINMIIATAHFYLDKFKDRRGGAANSSMSN